MASFRHRQQSAGSFLDGHVAMYGTTSYGVMMNDSWATLTYRFLQPAHADHAFISQPCHRCLAEITLVG